MPFIGFLAVVLTLIVLSWTLVGASLHVSPGTNYRGIPFRIGASPEVSVITLGRRDHATQT